MRVIGNIFKFVERNLSFFVIHESFMLIVHHRCYRLVQGCRYGLICVDHKVFSTVLMQN